MAEYYLILKALHIIAFTAWMAGLFYLPRLYVYHVNAIAGGEADLMLQKMEHRLLRFIMNPAMIITLLLGILLMKAVGLDALKSAGWFHSKMTLVFLMFGFHGMLSKWRKDFANGRNTKSEKFYRYANEVPTVLLIAIVLLVVLKPF
jgi:putative membrane protein